MLRLSRALLFVCLLAISWLAFAQQAGSSFDHMTTQFPLVGAHEQVRCETCHIKGIFKGTPITCEGCHVQNNQRGALAKPLNHIPTQPTDTCDACHTMASFTGGRFDHVMAAPGSCATCHDNFRAKGKSANHIATTLSCDQCHSTSSFTPVLKFDHAILGGNFTTCSTCHDNVYAKGEPANHLPTPDLTKCASCHVASTQNGFTTFAGGQMDHSGIVSGCATCHGPGLTGFAGVTSLVVMPPSSPMGPNSHIPSSTTCESCHLGSLPAGLIPANAAHPAPGSLFATPAPTTVQIHNGVTSGCSSCHDSNDVWMGVSAYPIAPGTVVPNAQYVGFQTRPLAAAGTYNVADASHPTTGDCSLCHGNTAYFTALDKPANHIPVSVTSLCTSCHTTSNFATIPTLTNIHANAPSTTTNCVQCHGSAAPSFAIPSANFQVVGLPSSHMPLSSSASCETCHVGAGSSIAATPVVDGAKFSGSLMSHLGITSNCVSCHVTGGKGSSYQGVSAIVPMPVTSPAGATSHIPSNTTCENCHAAPAGLIAAGNAKAAPGTLFATPLPSTAQIHTGVTSGCSTCHEAGNVWMGVSSYPIQPSVLTSGAQYQGFQTRPNAAGSQFSIADAAHPSVTAGPDCSQCHSNTNYFTAIDKPANHIPYATTAQCSSCHDTSNFATFPSLTNIHANAPAGNCAQCHGPSAASYAIPAVNFAVKGIPTGHIPTASTCETCHVGAGSSIAALPVVNGALFANSLMNHSGITSGCASCHGPGLSTSFLGAAPVSMPATSPAVASSHIPSSTTCENCHLANVPTGYIAAKASKTPPGTLFGAPAPTTAQIHNGVTSGCSSCHEAGNVWMGMTNYAISPSALAATASAQYTGFQTRPNAAGSLYSIADAAHPNVATGPDCAQCHGNTNYFTAQDKPANHIPVSATAQCTACHTTSNYATIPTLTNIHANAPAGNCAQCHGPTAASYAIPAANFAVKGLPAGHVPTATTCETCHVGAGSSIAALPVVNGALFANSLMSHSGITSGCASCHGPGLAASFVGSTVVVMPATSPAAATSHIPSSTTCETCHLGTVPTGLISPKSTKTAPGTLFATPAPNTAQIHTGITGGCQTCHEAGNVWMGMTQYPINPASIAGGTSSTQYMGFQTRPAAAGSTYSITDASHPGASTGPDCAQCHGNTNYFSAQDKPANHIPVSATAQCTACHTTSNYATIPTLTNIHANMPAGSNCATCHGPTAASYAIPAAAFAVKGLPTGHIPTTATCETCHVGAGSSIAALPVVNGALFANSLMSHSGITSGCASCHAAGLSGSFVGSTVVVMPPTTPVGPTSHIPSSSTCETCHLGTVPSGLIAAKATKTAPGTLFATPAPNTTQIHTGITSGCQSCHEASYTWMGVSNYPISPTTIAGSTSATQYIGFQTRPVSAASTYSVADAAHPNAATGPDCVACHSSTAFFSGQTKPANHIPYLATASCTACHTTSDYSVIPTLTNIHANLPSGSNCATCHGASAASYAIASANFAVKGQPSNHIPTTTTCETCHVGTGSSMAALPVVNGNLFTNSRMSHSGITTNCVSCHGTGLATSFIGSTVVVLPPTTPVGASSHIPSSTTCETCHLGTVPSGLIAAKATKTAPGTLFATPAPNTTQIHTGVTSGCQSCHEAGYVWMGMTNAAYAIAPTTIAGATASTQYVGFQTRPVAAASTFNVADSAHPNAATGPDCVSCHTSTAYFSGQIKPSNHIPYSTTAQCTSCHTTTNYATIPTLTNIHANLPAGSNCATCHGSSAASYAIPAASFVMKGQPTNHIPTSTTCETCHVGTGSSIAALPVVNGALFANSLMNHSGITAGCASCHGAGLATSFINTTVVVMPPTSPVGATSHIPSVTTCETCHLLSMPSGYVAAKATKTAPGTAFGAPAPTTSQIHTGITSGCSSCHEAGYVWMGMTNAAYAISPKTTSGGTSTTQYTGFQTRPTAAATTFSVADAAHPTALTGPDCGSCHTGTNYFTGEAKPTGHIPTNAACTQCHTVAGDYSVAALAPLATLHTGVTTCNGCHLAGSGGGPFAGCTTQATCTAPPPITYQPKAMPLAAGGSPTVASTSTHIPIASPSGTIPDCGGCHSKTTFTSFLLSPSMKGNSTDHAVVSANTCMSCHETGYKWYGATGIVDRPNGHHTGQDCKGCHSAGGNQFSGGAVIKPIVRAAVNGAVPRLLPDGVAIPGAAGQAFDHSGVLPGQCQTCHNGQAATGLSLKHLPTRASCDACHRTTAWIPAQFSHQGVIPGQCQTCHNSASASGKPSGHFVTARSCNVCHTTIGWVPVTYTHLSPLYQAQPANFTCVSCHVTNSEIIPRQLRSNQRPRPAPGSTGP